MDRPASSCCSGRPPRQMPPTSLHAAALGAVLLGVGLLPLGAGHGAMVHPRSRNSVDAFANLTEAQKRSATTFASCANLTGAPCDNGQSSYWYSQGCFIGCPECDHKSGRRQTDLCGKGFVGMLPDKAIAVNRAHATGSMRNSKYDIYRHNPWRAPGHAPVADACGLAGGTPWTADASEEGRYVSTSFAHHGMNGTDLPALPTGVQWKAGGTAEVTWNVKFNHGGGYSYRLCPASEPLTEACFQSHPLEFVQDKQALVFPNGTLLPIPAGEAVFVNEGTRPEGSWWSRLPLPGSGYGPRCGCDLAPDTYKPGNFACGCKMGEERGGCSTPGNCSSGACEPCPETAGSDCSRCDNPPHGGHSFPPPSNCGHECLGLQPGVLDVVKVPKLPTGKYILGFRYDCDASAQVWSSCADIELVE